MCSDVSSLWIKRDDATHFRYGGNKVRKLEYLLADACRMQARRIVTVGAAGSHHVLATAFHGIDAGFKVAALLTPMPFSRHALDNLGYALSLGLTAYPCRSIARLPFEFARTRRPGDYFIPPGGSSITGSMGYADAALELERQVLSGEVPEPDSIVVALGSGGTVAGLLAGLEETSLRCSVHAVRVVPWPMISGGYVEMLARAVSYRRSRQKDRSGIGSVPLRRRCRLCVVGDRLGRGYGFGTVWGDEAIARARSVGLELEATYTAKAFSHALRLVDGGRAGNVLYWHTLSGSCCGGLGGGIARELDMLWIRD